MKPRLLFATTNAGKLKELRLLVGEAVEVVSLKDLPPIPEPEETGPTFEAIAEQKAWDYVKASGLPCLADDSGLCVDALGGRPGIHSARYAPGDDRARYLKLLGELEGVPEERRTASFQCALCLAIPGKPARVEVGRCEGRILTAPRGSHGFGYDPVFYVPLLGKTVAELAPEEKAAVSHRGQAFRKMLPALLALQAGG